MLEINKSIYCTVILYGCDCCRFVTYNIFEACEKFEYHFTQATLLLFNGMGFSLYVYCNFVIIAKNVCLNTVSCPWLPILHPRVCFKCVTYIW